jgi:hypothetical protein
VKMRRDCSRMTDATVLIIPRPNMIKIAIFSRGGRGMLTMSFTGRPRIQRSIRIWNAEVATEG